MPFKKGSPTALRQSAIMEKLKPKYRARMLGNSITKGRKLNLTEEHRQKLRDRIAKTNAKGFVNKGGRCKHYTFRGIRAQGRYELIYLIRQLKLGVDISRAKPIKTPFGWYTPDYDLGNHYVDVKSTYTIRTCLKNGQIRKILWVRKHIKRVKLVVLKEKEVEKEFLELLSKQPRVKSA